MWIQQHLAERTDKDVVKWTPNLTQIVRKSLNIANKIAKVVCRYARIVIMNIIIIAINIVHDINIVHIYVQATR